MAPRGHKFNDFNKFSILFDECFRCVEDQAVSNRLKEIWSNTVAAIKHLEYLPKSHRPPCKSFDDVVQWVSMLV